LARICDTQPTYVAHLAVNVFGAAFVFIRKFFLKDTGRKLSHLDKQLHTVGPRCQRLGLKRSPIEMPRGYELEDFLTPRDVSEGREPTREPSSRDQVHYRGRNLTEKVRAGFSIYARAEDALKLRRVLDQRELTAEILSL